MKRPTFHTLRSQQFIPQARDRVWEFFSNPRNLEALTPPWLGFRVLTPGQIAMKKGAEIRYRIHWHAIPIGWTTTIRLWDPPFRFVDIQRGGPYQLWHHTHRFTPRDGGTQMSDVVRYRLPFGIAGRIMHRWKVRRDLEKIFEYRHRRVKELFPSDS